MQRFLKTQELAAAALFTALAFGLLLLEFPVPSLFPPFLKFDLSDVAALIGGILLGPVAAVSIELGKNLLNLLFRSNSGGVGEAANFLAGSALVLPPVVLYRRTRSNAGLLAGMGLGILLMVAAACAANYYVILPLYLGSQVGATQRMAMLATIYIPFNLVKGTVACLVGFVLHLAMKNIYPLLLAGRRRKS
ncbi:ECF transporter S component [Anaerotalea alkaliphila]|uniref:Riboflavin transporter n=1 Tax=Anaerotalea alkaliphila TaxID=2662126 RepID=A0A7X5HTS2_9FIRM|nr:ECF transporter S component [Anaerotalea alkaliphila]NDL66504.1 ECF transporter S component [Anaerotalea alkaliphila]